MAVGVGLRAFWFTYFTCSFERFAKVAKVERQKDTGTGLLCPAARRRTAVVFEYLNEIQDMNVGLLQHAAMR